MRDNDEMKGNRVDTPLRAMGLAVALFAITLNFLQPLAHAALMRDGAPSSLWSVFCKSMPEGRDGATGSAPTAVIDHDCCLGLAHAPALMAPCSAFTLLAPSTPALAPSLPVEQTGSAGIRDGSHRPRGPPSLLA